MSNRGIPHAIQWHEGMLLAPQHFQQLALRHEALVQYSALAISPYLWGIRRLKFDSDQLLTGSIVVQELEGIMPDGTVVFYEKGHTQELSLDLKPFADRLQNKPLMVHLAVPIRASQTSRGELQRYMSIEGDTISDENAADSEIRIPRLLPRLELLATDEPPAKYVSFPVAEVTLRDNVFGLTDFVPPLVEVPLQSQLSESCTLVARRLREKALVLSEQVRSPSSTSQMPSVLGNKSRIQCIVAALPALEALLATGRAHPYELYLALCNVAGNVAPLAPGMLPPTFPAYRHENLLASFVPVITFILKTLTEGISEIYTGFAFRMEKNSFKLDFRREWVDRRLVLALRSQAGYPEKDTIAWAESVLIGTSRFIESMRQRRVLGAQRQFVPSDEELLVTKGVVLFSLTPDSEYTRAGEVLEIVPATDRPDLPKPAEIILYVRNN